MQNKLEESGNVGTSKTSAGAALRDAIHRDLTDGPWCWFAKEAYNRAFDVGGCQGIALYATLCRLESDAGKRSKAKISATLACLARKSGIGRRKVIELLQEFERVQIVKVTRPTGVRRLAHGSNEYTLLKTYPQATDGQAEKDTSGKRRKRTPGRFQKSTSRGSRFDSEKGTSNSLKKKLLTEHFSRKEEAATPAAAAAPEAHGAAQPLIKHNGLPIGGF